MIRWKYRWLNVSAVDCTPTHPYIHAKLKTPYIGMPRIIANA